MDIRRKIAKQILLLDGVLKPNDQFSPISNLAHPEEIKQFHQVFRQAGADIITANTLGADRCSLQSHHAVSDIQKINTTAVGLARQVAGDAGLVAAAIGGTKSADFTDVKWDFDEHYANYQEQARLLVACGIDLLIIEEIPDLPTLRAAIIAVNSVRGKVPLLVFTTDFNAELSAQAVMFESLDVDLIGFSGTPDKCLDALAVLRSTTNLPLAVRLKSVKDASSNALQPFFQGDVAIVGCGSASDAPTLKIWKKMSAACQPLPRQQAFPLRVASPNRVVAIGARLPFVKIGERINPTGRQTLARELTAGRLETVLRDAQSQSEHAADLLDINVGAPLVDEPLMMTKAVRLLQQQLTIPLCLDSASPAVIEAGLKNWCGKALVNSVNAKSSRLQEFLPLVKKYGAAVIGLCIGDTMPTTVDERLTMTQTIIATCQDYGIPLTNLLIDPAALAIATDAASGPAVLETIRQIKSKFDLPVSLGVSNTSFGLPERALVHNTFLVQAIGAGLDAALLNLLDENVADMIAAASLFAGRDPDCRQFLKSFRQRQKRAQ